MRDRGGWPRTTRPPQPVYVSPSYQTTDATPGQIRPRCAGVHHSFSTNHQATPTNFRMLPSNSATVTGRLKSIGKNVPWLCSLARMSSRPMAV